jgi:VanZ family protein
MTVKTSIANTAPLVILATLAAVATFGRDPWLPTIPFADKLGHLLGFLALAAACRFAGFSAGRFIPALVLIGIGIEITQETMTTWRSWESSDIVADVAGLALESASVSVVQRLRRRAESEKTEFSA